MYRVALCLFLLMGLLVVAAPVAAEGPCDPGIVYFASYGDDDVNDGMKESPFATKAKAEAILKATTGGGCVLELALNDDDVEQVVNTYIYVLAAASGAPLASEVMLSVLAGVALILIGGGVWLRRRTHLPVGA